MSTGTTPAAKPLSAPSAKPPASQAVTGRVRPKQSPAPQYPVVEIGDIVYWYHGRAFNPSGLGEDSPTPVLALVTFVDDQPGMLGLAKLPKDNAGFQLPEGGVRHRNDPVVARLSTSDDAEEGFWDMPPGKLTASEVVKIRAILAERDAADSRESDPTGNQSAA